MNLLFLKLTLVPLFVALVTFVGKRFGSKWAGVLGAMPVVAGPIVFIMIMEQGEKFGQVSALSAVSSVICYIAFGLTYSWVCRKYNWIISLFIANIAWLIATLALMSFKQNIWLCLIIAFGSIIIGSKLTPKYRSIKPEQGKGVNIYVRMLAGALLTLLVSGLASITGGKLSGILAAYPIMGTILTVSTHLSQNYKMVAIVFNGMARGITSFVFFFTALYFLLGHLHIILCFVIAAVIAILSQLIIMGILYLIAKRRIIAN